MNTTEPMFASASPARTSTLTRWLLAGLCASLLGATGCAARARASTAAVVVVEEPVMEVATAPVAIETYPRHSYHGRYVYLVDGRWYYRAHSRWVVYTVEPAPLARVRVGYEVSVRKHRAARPEMASPKPKPKKKGHARGHQKR